MLRTIGKLLGLIGLFVFGVLFALMITLIFLPELVINEKLLRLGLTFMTKPEQFNAEQLDVSVVSEDWRHKLVRIYLHKVCVDFDAVEGCAKNVWVQFGFDLIGKPILIYHIGPAALTEGDFKFKSHPSEKAPWDEPEEGSESDIKDWYQTFESYVKKVKIEPIKVTALRLASSAEDGTEKSAILNAQASYHQGGRLQFHMEIKDVKGDPITELTVDGTLRNWHEELRLPVGALQVQASLDSGWVVSSSAKSSVDSGGDKLGVQIGSSFSKGSQTSNFHSQVTISKNGRFTAEAKGEVPMPVEALESVSLPRCSFEGGFSISKSTAQVQVNDCVLDITRRRLELEERTKSRLPTKVGIALGGKVSVSPAGLKGKITTDMRPVQTDLYKIDSRTVIALNMSNNSKATESLEVTTKSSIELNRFEVFTRELNEANLLVPAPLNSLRGKLKCVVEGKLLFDEGIARVPHKCEINLDGDEQRFLVTEKGELKVLFTNQGVQPSIKSEIILSDVNMRLPNFSIIGGVPPFMPEKRYTDKELRRAVSIPDDAGKSGNTNTQASVNFAYDIRIRTAHKPVRIAVPHYKTTVPFETDLYVTNDKPLRGELRVKKFDLKVVKRPIYIERVNLGFEPTGVTTLDAMAMVKQTDYDVRVNALGTIDKPNFVVSSDPPQAEEQLVSSLLYGQPAGELGADERQSVAETQAAMTDGALGLLSFFYLASTPVERVGYDPQTGNVRASVRLQDRTSLIVGSDFETSSTAGLRRRLFGNWSIETVAVRESETGVNKGVAVLRWAKRY